MPKLNLGRVKGDKGDSFTFDDFTPDQLDGITPKMLLGDVTTLDPDENATVGMRKDGLKNYVDFGIPRGKNGAEIKNISAENVAMANGTTLESTMTVVNEDVDANTDEINKIKTPTFTDTVGTYTTLNAANTAAETSSNAIKSKVSIFTTLSNIKKSFSAIVQGLKILRTNVGMIQGITSDLNSESDYIAASSKALATLNGNLRQTTEGRFVLPNGLVIQWGSVFATEGKAEIHFPIHYRNIPAIMANCEWGDNTNALVANVKYVTSSGAVLSVSVLTGQQIIGAGGNNVHWMSIGY